MTAANFAAALPFAVLAACLYRARLLALALIPPCALILARSLDLVDTSSASHPLRWLTPVACAGLAGMALSPQNQGSAANRRLHIASILVLGSCAPDLLALHPFFWARFAEWPLVPVQVAVCISILVVLLSPERWVRRWIPM